MQVHAIYEDGRLTFQQPIRLKNQRIELEVTIPDNYIEEAAKDESKPVLVAPIEQNPASNRVSPTRERLDAILGKWRYHGGPSGKVEYKKLWHEHLEEKYLAKS
jgi:hypothetical protein